MKKSRGGIVHKYSRDDDGDNPDFRLHEENLMDIFFRRKMDGMSQYVQTGEQSDEGYDYRYDEGYVGRESELVKQQGQCESEQVACGNDELVIAYFPGCEGYRSNRGERRVDQQVDNDQLREQHGVVGHVFQPELQ